jgi:hypothetical protein
MKIFLTALVLFCSTTPFSSKAQDTKDTSSLKNYLKKGKFSFYTRTFIMSTVNKGILKDDAAWAAGAGIRYETPEWKGFSAAMSGFFIYNIASTDLNEKDSASGQKNRYETGLFDITDPSNKTDLDRMEELYLRFRFKHTTIAAGRQFINTPFINKQDGRMRPTVVEGISIKTAIKNKWLIDVLWMKRISPRTTVSWYNTGESIGIYPPGVNPDGSKSGYPGNTSSRGVLISGISCKTSSLHMQLWNTYVENIMNTSLFQPEYKFSFTEKNKFMAGLQFVYQSGTGAGGNTDVLKTYYPPRSHTWIFSTRIGYEKENWKSNVNFIHISNDGRFLMPREWGREPFYTFMPRERNEGLGGVTGFTINNELITKTKKWKFGMGYGRYYLPNVSNYRLNKYGMPSYQQVNLQIDYQFGGFLKNLDLQALAVWKGDISKIQLNPFNIINRVSMLNSNLVLNYHF